MQFPANTAGSQQLPVTPALGNPSFKLLTLHLWSNYCEEEIPFCGKRDKRIMRHDIRSLADSDQLTACVRCEDILSR